MYSTNVCYCCGLDGNYRSVTCVLPAATHLKRYPYLQSSDILYGSSLSIHDHSSCHKDLWGHGDSFPHVRYGTINVSRTLSEADCYWSRDLTKRKVAVYLFCPKISVKSLQLGFFILTKTNVCLGVKPHGILQFKYPHN